ncbi:MAG: DUF177 domain-containing protein [Anaerolineales bacterium]|nr:DUF177 domain-containing protein [Anaerolineales bacterium]
MRLNVGFILHEQVGFSRIFDIDCPSVQIDDQFVLSNLHGEIRLTRTNQGVYANGHLQAYHDLECVRCLNIYSHTFDVNLNELFTLPAAASDDPLLHIPETGILDLQPILREHFLVSVPMQPLCRPNCKGLCPVCGANTNDVECHHTENDIDPRLAVLQSLLED